MISLALSLMVSSAQAGCPDLTGVYSRDIPQGKIVLEISTRVENGVSIYDLKETGPASFWKWQSIADGEEYPKELNPDHVNVAEVAYCKDSQTLHRSLTGDWLNGDLVPFDLEVDITLTSESGIRWYGDFSGYGLSHVITDYSFSRH